MPVCSSLLAFLIFVYLLNLFQVVAYQLFVARDLIGTSQGSHENFSS